MGEVDILTKEYMSDNAVFADAFNYFLYDGKSVIQEDRLKDLNVEVNSVILGSNDHVYSMQKYRDHLKSWCMKCDETAVYLLLGIENQTKIHYAMPVRNMVYDALQYDNQVKRIEKKHKKGTKDKKITADEYLSGFYKSDHLIPVITLVIYFGADNWDGPETLHEMFNISDKTLLKYSPDYRLNLIVPSRMTKDEMDLMATDLREVLLYIKYSKDKDQLDMLLREDERFNHMDRKTMWLINEVTCSKLKIEEKEREINMCQAIDEMRQDARNEGVRHVVKKLLIQNKLSDEDICDVSNISKELLWKIKEEINRVS